MGRCRLKYFHKTLASFVQHAQLAQRAACYLIWKALCEFACFHGHLGCLHQQSLHSLVSRGSIRVHVKLGHVHCSVLEAVDSAWMVRSLAYDSYTPHEKLGFAHTERSSF